MYTRSFTRLEVKVSVALHSSASKCFRVESFFFSFCVCQLLEHAWIIWLVALFLRLEGGSKSIFKSLSLSLTFIYTHFLACFPFLLIRTLMQLAFATETQFPCAILVFPVTSLFLSLSSPLLRHQVLVATGPALN